MSQLVDKFYTKDEWLKFSSILFCFENLFEWEAVRSNATYKSKSSNQILIVLVILSSIRRFLLVSENIHENMNDNNETIKK